MEHAKPLLDDVPVGKEFWTRTGTVLHNLRELTTYLEGCSDLDYRYHVNVDHQKNDFAKWIAEVVRDEPLAHSLRSHLSRRRYLLRVRKHLAKLLRTEREEQIARFAG